MSQTTASIRYVKDKNDEVFFPVTHERGVVDSNGINIVTKLAGKQETLISGNNIKTINGSSILGPGNIEVQTEITMDNVPTSGSDNPVKSSGLYAELAGKVGSDDIDNVVELTKAQYDALSTKDSRTMYIISDSAVESEHVGIASLVQTTTSSADGGTNVWTCTLTNGQAFTLEVKNGNQGNSGYTGAAGELEVVNNLTDGGSTAALSAEMGKTLEGEISQLGSEVMKKQPSSNLINPDEFQWSKYITSNGGIADGSARFGVSGFISVFNPATGVGSDIISNGQQANYASTYAVYDINKTHLRSEIGASASQQYTYQAGDAFVRFCYSSGDNDITTCLANYGTTLLPYVEYSEFTPLTSLQENVNALRSDVDINTEAIPNKLDKINGNNLINPDTIIYSKYIRSSDGSIIDGGSAYCVSDYIPVIDNGEGKSVISNAFTSPYTASYAVYDENKTVLRTISQSQQYTYQSGDAFIRIQLYNNPNEDFAPQANYGTTLLDYEPYTDYLPLAELELRVDALDGGEKEDLVAYAPNYIYAVYNANNINRNYAQRLWLAHCLSGNQFIGSDLSFKGGPRFQNIIPVFESSKSESDVSYVISGKSYNDKNISSKLRIVNSASSKSVTPKILVIGDSVTNGYGSGSNKSESWLPNQYWAYAKMFFEMDKIDGGDNSNEYNAVFIGGNSAGNFTINYNGVQRLVRAAAVGKGGATIDELYTSTWGGDGTINPFYNGSTFSILYYINRYRTMDDLGVRLVSNSSNPAGQTVTGSDGNQYTIGTQITSQALLAQYDVCTPSCVVISMTHNTTLANFQTYAQQVITTIHGELSNATITFLTIDETGTYFPIDFPDYNATQITYTNTLHSKNVSIYNYLASSVEDEDNNVYVLGANFVQPTAESYPTIKYFESDSVLGNEWLNVMNPEVSGPNYHMNNKGHSAVGYALYAFLKYINS